MIDHDTVVCFYYIFQFLEFSFFTLSAPSIALDSVDSNTICWQSRRGTCTAWRHGIFLTTSRASLFPTVAVSGRRHPRSCTRLSTVGDRAFPVARCRLWNSLPPDVTSASTLSVVQKRLKTYLFSRSFPS